MSCGATIRNLHRRWWILRPIFRSRESSPTWSAVPSSQHENHVVCAQPIAHPRQNRHSSTLVLNPAFCGHATRSTLPGPSRTRPAPERIVQSPAQSSADNWSRSRRGTKLLAAQPPTNQAFRAVSKYSTPGTIPWHANCSNTSEEKGKASEDFWIRARPAVSLSARRCDLSGQA